MQSWHIRLTTEQQRHTLWRKQKKANNDMRQLTNHEIERAGMLKAMRAAIRLKYALEADKELYRRLPELQRRIDSALLKGEAFKVTAAELLEDATT
jgi:hypothetical protein